MKKCKTILLLLILITVVLFLGSCGNTGRNDDPAATAGSATETQNTEQTAASTSETAAVTTADTATSETTAEADGEFHLDENLLPRLDGSTSQVPLAKAILKRCTDLTEAEIEARTQFSRTTASYYNLMGGRADLLIVGDSNEDIMAYKAECGFEWVKEAFCLEGFIFVVNEDNPVDSITVEEARKIYTGEITNWQELGGADLPITAFQRNHGAGSQTLMEKLIMQGTPMAEAPTEYVIDSMNGLIEAVKSYDNQPGAIGYTVYYYAEKMRMAQGLKMLKLEGVEPTNETIRSGEYPAVNPNFIVMSAKCTPDSVVSRLFYWLLSEEGQQLIAEEGYVSVMDLEPGQRKYDLDPVGEYYTGTWDGLKTMQLRGPAARYAVSVLDNEIERSRFCLYGLMTASGRALTPPVFSEVKRLQYYRNHRMVFSDVYALRASEPGENGESVSKYTLAAADLSWIYPETFDRVVCGACGIAAQNGDRLYWISLDGQLLNSGTLTDAEIGSYIGETFKKSEMPTYFQAFYGNCVEIAYISGSEPSAYAYYSFEQNRLITVTADEANASGEASGSYTLYGSLTENTTNTVFDFNGEKITLPCDRQSVFLGELFGEVVLVNGGKKCYLKDGTELFPGTEAWAYIPQADELENSVAVIASYTDDTLALVTAEGRVFRLHDKTLSAAGLGTTYTVSSFCGFVELIESDQASYYSIETGECVFRMYFDLAD